ncbi:MAG: hypothetical protein IPL67_00610 [Ignavibacteria bacterium]|nr:hypothetical protein [Ignavibacteria bacterium]
MLKFTTSLLILFFVIISNANSSPVIGFEQLMINAEENPSVVMNARDEAIRQNLPVSIMTLNNVIAEVKSLESGAPVYSVITNYADIYNGGYTAFFYELRSSIDLSRARIDYGNGNVTDNTGGHFDLKFGDSRGIVSYLMVPDITQDRVYFFNAANGDLVDTAFIPQARPQLSTPKHALTHFNGKDILLADQITDLVQKFNSNGKYNNYFAPIGGVNTSILDNMRGIRYRADNSLLVTVGSGANINTIQQFDTAGNHLGTFIPNTNITSPFDILMRGSDMLVANFSGTNRITNFDLNGTFISQFYVGSDFAFPQQIQALPNGNIIVAAFSPPSGISYLTSTGSFVKLMTGITGNRGVYLLGNGNYLTTNGAGAHEIDSATGALVRTIATGSMQYIEPYVLDNITMRLNFKFQAINAQDTVTVELRDQSSPYALVESKTAVGGQGIPSLINFNTPVSGTPYYIVVKHRNSIETWSSTPRSFNGYYLRYDFTTSPTQAYGNNMYDLIGSMAFFTGDANQDGTVDGSDAGLIDNDAFNFVNGYVSTDLNYDDIVDATDASLADNNAFNFVGVVRP